MIGILYLGRDGYKRKFRQPKAPKANIVKELLDEFLAHYAASPRAPGKAQVIYAHPITLKNMPKRYKGITLVHDKCMPLNHYLIGVENESSVRRSFEQANSSSVQDNSK